MKKPGRQDNSSGCWHKEYHFFAKIVCRAVSKDVKKRFSTQRHHSWKKSSMKQTSIPPSGAVGWTATHLMPLYAGSSGCNSGSQYTRLCAPLQQRSFRGITVLSSTRENSSIRMKAVRNHALIFLHKVNDFDNECTCDLFLKIIEKKRTKWD